MTWDKPNTPLKWLTLFAPPAMCVIATVAGGLIDPKEGNWMAWALMGLLAASVTSLGLSGYLARKNDSGGATLACILVIFGIYMVVNCAVSFAGCAAGSSFLPGLNFH
jgi:hypothetical protein